MKKYRIKIEVKESGNIYIPQSYEGFFIGWVGFVKSSELLFGSDSYYLTEKEAVDMIEDYKRRQTKEIIYKDI